MSTCLLRFLRTYLLPYFLLKYLHIVHIYWHSYWCTCILIYLCTYLLTSVLAYILYSMLNYLKSCFFPLPFLSLKNEQEAFARTFSAPPLIAHLLDNGFFFFFFNPRTFLFLRLCTIFILLFFPFFFLHICAYAVLKTDITWHTANVGSPWRDWTACQTRASVSFGESCAHLTSGVKPQTRSLVEITWASFSDSCDFYEWWSAAFFVVV